MSVSSQEVRAVKPLGIKAYGHIAHLPGSRLGPGDHRVHDGQARIATVKTRDRQDRVIVQEKLDGSCVAVAIVDGTLVALVRAGYPAFSSPYPQHHMFAVWVQQHESRFRNVLNDGERLVGEWLAQAHGTKYDLKYDTGTHDPFVAFDLMIGTSRVSFTQFKMRVMGAFAVPAVVADDYGESCSVEQALELLGPRGFHGATETIEGAVWRVERKGKLDFLCKYVRPDKVDGCYLPEVSGKDAVWNWREDEAHATVTGE